MGMIIIGYVALLVALAFAIETILKQQKRIQRLTGHRLSDSPSKRCDSCQRLISGRQVIMMKKCVYCFGDQGSYGHFPPLGSMPDQEIKPGIIKEED